jgi:pyruvate kinase
MIEHPRPTRAEASDVANAIFDNTDAVMLSGESASGRYPIESVEMMARIVDAAENAMRQGIPRAPSGDALRVAHEFADVTAGVACRAAKDAGASNIVTFTVTGTTARLLSRYRPETPIIAFSPNQEVRRRMALLWGVMPRVLEPVQETEEMVRRVEEELLARGLAKRGDRIVIVFGAPIGQPGHINSLRLHTISM